MGRRGHLDWEARRVQTHGDDVPQRLVARRPHRVPHRDDRVGVPLAHVPHAPVLQRGHRRRQLLRGEAAGLGVLRLQPGRPVLPGLCLGLGGDVVLVADLESQGLDHLRLQERNPRGHSGRAGRHFPQWLTLCSLLSAGHSTTLCRIQKRACRCPHLQGRCRDRPGGCWGSSGARAPGAARPAGPACPSGARAAGPGSAGRGGCEPAPSRARPCTRLES